MQTSLGVIELELYAERAPRTVKNFLNYVNKQFYAEPAFPTKNERCVSCHGALGVSNYTYFPNIAGQKRTYLSNQLKAFRDGTRSDPWMTPMARDLSDKEIDALAEFYSKLQVRQANAN